MAKKMADIVTNEMSRVSPKGSVQHATITVADELTTDCLLIPHEIRRSDFGQFGVYVTESISAGTRAVVFGGFVTQGPRFRELPEHRQRHSLQIGEDLFLACGEALNDVTSSTIPANPTSAS